MPLTLGSVSVAADGTVTKSGECGALYDILEATALDLLHDFDPSLSFPTGADDMKRRRAQARQATAMATYIHGLLTARATAKIAAGTSGLQVTPNPNDPDTNCEGPFTDKFLPIV